MTPKYKAKALSKGIWGSLDISLCPTPSPLAHRAGTGSCWACMGLLRGFLCSYFPLQCPAGCCTHTVASWAPVPGRWWGREGQSPLGFGRGSWHFHPLPSTQLSISRCQGSPSRGLLCAPSLPPSRPPFQPSPSSNVFPCQPFPARSSGSPNCLTFPPALINAPCAVPVTSPSVLHLSEIAAFYGGSLFHQEFEQKYFQSTPSDLFRFPTHHISL